MLPATVARIAQLPRVAAVKEAVPQVSRVREILEQVPAGFVVLSGDDASARETVLAGAKGVISVTANVVPRAMADMIAAALRGDAAAPASSTRASARCMRLCFWRPIPFRPSGHWRAWV